MWTYEHIVYPEAEEKYQQRINHEYFGIDSVLSVISSEVLYTASGQNGIETIFKRTFEIDQKNTNLVNFVKNLKKRLHLWSEEYLNRDAYTYHCSGLVSLKNQLWECEESLFKHDNENSELIKEGKEPRPVANFVIYEDNIKTLVKQCIINYKKRNNILTNQEKHLLSEETAKQVEHIKENDKKEKNNRLFAWKEPSTYGLNVVEKMPRIKEDERKVFALDCLIRRNGHIDRILSVFKNATSNNTNVEDVRTDFQTIFENMYEGDAKQLLEEHPKNILLFIKTQLKDQDLTNIKISEAISAGKINENIRDKFIRIYAALKFSEQQKNNKIKFLKLREECKQAIKKLEQKIGVVALADDFCLAQNNEDFISLKNIIKAFNSEGLNEVNNMLDSVIPFDRKLCLESEYIIKNKGLN